ncbi:MAG: hypothetical protein BWX50_01310 [Euryarchaeota archaeon ADurb.Bin009]|nr:MAG: hypothetical protein BWX50_01310 [Euryarchaeota archaeon ADurb.Bin009]
MLLNWISSLVPCIRSQSISSWLTISGSFVSVRIISSNRCALAFAPVRETTSAGVPVVSCAYSTAADIPIPCCPRLCRIW